VVAPQQPGRLASARWCGRRRSRTGEVPFDHCTIAQIIFKRYAGVVDEDIEKLDFSTAP
jgi:hypothetical protein